MITFLEVAVGVVFGSVINAAMGAVGSMWLRKRGEKQLIERYERAMVELKNSAMRQAGQHGERAN